MKKPMALILVFILLFPIIGLAESNEDRDAAMASAREFDARAWIVTGHASTLIKAMFDEPLVEDGKHYLWDILYGLSPEELIAEAKKNVDINMVFTEYDDMPFCMIDTESNVSLFGYPIYQSYFGFLEGKTDVGLSAGSKGSAGLKYALAQLRLFPLEGESSPNDAIILIEKIYNECLAAYGKETSVSVKVSKDDRTGDVFKEGGSIDYEKLEELFLTEKLISLRIYWNNVCLYVHKSLRSIDAELSFS